MDRRQRKSRQAIFRAFTELLKKESYGKITVQQIIDLGDVGRTTFYTHFETKDDVLRALYQNCGLESEGQGIAFSLPVENVVGLKEK